MSTAMFIPAGAVAGLWRYPVKSMRGEAMQEAGLGWHGLHWDRRYALQRVDRTHPNGLPWASAREFPSLVTWSARLETEAAKPRVLVVAPDGIIYEPDDPALASRLSDELGDRVVMTHLARGTYDAMDVSLITTRSIASVADRVGRSLEVERFRPNLLLETSAERAYPEDKWVGKSLALGDGSDPARLRLNRKDPRCRIVDLDPITGEASGDVFSIVVRERRNLLGVYASVERCGTICVGDAVAIRRFS